MQAGRTDVEVLIGLEGSKKTSSGPNVERRRISHWRSGGDHVAELNLKEPKLSDWLKKDHRAQSSTCKASILSGHVDLRTVSCDGDR